MSAVTLRLDTWPTADGRISWCPDIIIFQPEQMRFIVGGAMNYAAMIALGRMPWHIALKFDYSDDECTMDGTIDAASITVGGDYRERRLVLMLMIKKIHVAAKPKT